MYNLLCDYFAGDEEKDVPKNAGEYLGTLPYHLPSGLKLRHFHAIDGADIDAAREQFNTLKRNAQIAASR